MVKRCAQCCLSEKFPGIHFDQNGICNLCQEWTKKGEAHFSQTRKVLTDKLEEAIEKSRQSKGDYHCLLAFSGGKDSTYTLYLLRERYKLKVLAYTIDNGFVSPTAIENGRNVCDQLGVDWVLYRPNQKFMKTVYRNSIENSPYDKKTLTRSSEICASCIQVVNAVVLREAIRRQIPLIAGGYIGAQVPSDSPVFKGYSDFIDAYRKKTIQDLNTKLHPDFSRYVNLSEYEKQGEFPTIINPLLLEDYNEKDIIKLIQTIGWVMPSNTGKNSSNCQLNEYGVKKHVEKYEFHPYELEICQQVRRGFMSPQEALDRLNDVNEKSYYDRIESILNSNT